MKDDLPILFSMGDMVRITTGTFAGLVGVVDFLEPPGTATVMLEIYERKTPVELSLEQLERVVV